MSEDLRIDRPSNVFRHVRFLLLGFDPVNQPTVLSKLVNGGGVDAVRYGPDCTHVIVDNNIPYDDPACVAARNDGKVLVTGLWVDHSLDLGMPVDTTSIMYKPVRDLKGIPGAKSLVVCLTGYQRQDREDIMTMVGLMGANFSKPLIANKVTHLVCYKFEGDKYALAKRTKKIKIINQLWLEDCLKAWEILPEADYTKSGFELDVLEAEVKDSEEADITSKENKLLDCNQESKRKQLDSSASRDLSDLSMHGKQRISDQERSKDPNHSIAFNSPDCSALREAKCGQAVELYERASIPIINHLASASGNERSPNSEAKSYSARTYSRKTRQTAGKGTGDMSTDSTVIEGKFNVNDNCGIPVVLEHVKDKSDIVCSGSPSSGVLPQHEVRSDRFNENGKLDVSYTSPKLEKPGENSKSCISVGLQEVNRKELSEAPSLASGQNETSEPLLSDSHPHYTSLTASLSTQQRSSARISRLVSQSSGMKSSKVGTTISKTVNSDISKHARSEEALKINSTKCKEDSLQSKPKNEDEDTLNRQEHFSGEVLSSRSQLKGSDHSHAETHFKPSTTTTKMCDKETCSKANTTKLKGSFYLSKCTSKDDPEISSIVVEKAASYERLAVIPPEVNHKDSRAAADDVLQARNEVQEKFTSMDDENFTSIDDETETPDDNEDNVMKAVSEGRTGEGDNSDDQITNEADGMKSGVHNHTISGKDEGDSKQQKVNIGKRKLDKGGTKQEKVNNGKRKLDESTYLQKQVKESLNRRKKRSSSKTENNVDPSKAPEVKKVPEAVIKENYDEVESEIVGKQLEVHSLTMNDEDKDAAKQKNEKTCSKRKLAQSADLEKTAKLNLSKGKRCTRNKIGRTISSETLEVKGKNEFNLPPCEENDGESELGIAVNLGAGDKSEDMQTSEIDCDALGVHSDKTSGLKKDGTKQNKGTCSKRELRTSTNVETASDNINGGQKHLSRRFRKETGVSNVKLAAEAEVEKNEAGVIDKVANSIKNEQRNKLNCVGDQNVSRGKNKVRKLAFNKASTEIASEENKLRLQVQADSKPEPACFIVSGHKQQRKEFQQVIRRLKAKVCKDSHQWSYQATHFIAPDPIRRTEKFFAAAASGRWILKANYISDSSKEGKLLAEEPYEWHKNGLSEDGSINLEAPRKWRIQRERTGHGAFYGMRIIIYGDCIAPSLDTLKRVVKAGDGTILATSPPYTRFLKSGVDFAVVSPSTPHADIWVQEFSRNEIPCVLADYLVDFVCKPGYSLGKHVQFNTHAWAEKSYKNLVNKSESDSGLMNPLLSGSDCDLQCPEARLQDGCGDNDLLCQVCGTCDRGEEMLICGHAKNAAGCGTVVHIDCCDPPLRDAPKEEWLCSKCGKSKSRKRTPKNAVKRSPVSKRKK